MITVRSITTYDVFHIVDASVLDELEDFVTKYGLYLDRRGHIQDGRVTSNPSIFNFDMAYYKYGDYLLINTSDHRKFFTRSSLDEFEETHPDDDTME